MSSNSADASNSLGIVHFKQGNLAEAAQCFRQALRADPHHAEACNNLGIIMLEEAIACFRKARAVKPDHVPGNGNVLPTLQFRSEYDIGYNGSDQNRPTFPEVTKETKKAPNNGFLDDDFNGLYRHCFK